MKRKTTEDYLISEILSNIPKKCKPVSYIAAELEISKSSAYRRLEGKQPFLFEEICKLATTMNFSVDSIIREQNKESLTRSHQNEVKEPEGSILNLLDIYYRFINSFCYLDNKKVIISANRITLPFIAEFDSLFIFYLNSQYYKSVKPEASLSSFDIDISEDIRKTRESIVECQLSFDQTDYILDKTLFTSIVHEIQYFRRLRMISDEFFKKLKDELYLLIDKMVWEMETGKIRGGNLCNYFLSWLDVENNSIVADGGQKHQEFLLNYGASIIKTGVLPRINPNNLAAQKKFAVLITQSNDFIRSDFIANQRKIIESMDDINFAY